MPNETLEQKVNAPQQEKKEEKKPVNVLESVVNETVGAIKAGVNIGIGTAGSLAGYALTGNAGVLVTSAAFVAGTKGKKNSKTIRDEFLSGAIFGTAAHYSNLPIGYMTTKLQKFAYMIPWFFGINAFYMAEDHLIKNKSPKGLYQKFKENYWNVIKKASWLPFPINLASALFLPQQYFLYTMAAAVFLFRRFAVGGKGQEYDDKRPYPVAAASAIYKFGKGVKGIYEGALGIGRTLGDYMLPRPAAPSQKPA